ARGYAAAFAQAAAHDLTSPQARLLNRGEDGVALVCDGDESQPMRPQPDSAGVCQVAFTVGSPQRHESDFDASLLALEYPAQVGRNATPDRKIQVHSLRSYGYLHVFLPVKGRECRCVRSGFRSFVQPRAEPIA